METYTFLFVALGLSLGILYTIKAIRDAKDDPETFEDFKKEGKYKKPADWKVGQMPEDIKKKSKLNNPLIDYRPDYHLISQN
ncbi:hypothetical protein SAMN04488057_10681 [Cyclobacterium lianum]|uniref:Uncharacterized protein n=1 Tax=Cyclobacterium lianum TaxID=388280 RepID=A0A1M7NUP1_9BACT|nr:hypothetical protein [Cyclobacterium lianum]SHN07677.1 hypothetical protein SAMN04488057_10681 [Cyclobacterium lianum]